MIIQIFCLTLPPLVWGLSIFVRIALGPPRGRGAVRGEWHPRTWAASVREQRIGVAAALLAIVGSLVGFYLLAWWTDDVSHLFWWFSSFKTGWAAGALGVWVLSLAVAVAGLWRDPSRGRRRCSNCWYDFARAPVATPCPECGRVHRAEWQLRRTRTSWRTVRFAGLIFASSYFVYVGHRIVTHGAIGLVPTTLMIAGFEYLPEGIISRYNGKGGELADRVLKGQLPFWQYEWLTARLSRALASARDVRTVALCSELAPAQFVFPAHPTAQDDAIRALLDDALLHAVDPSTRTQEAVAIAVGIVSSDSTFDWYAWFSCNEDQIGKVIGQSGLGSWSITELAWERAPATVEWFSRLSEADPSPATRRDRTRVYRFLLRVESPDVWLETLWTTLPAERQVPCAKALFTTPASEIYRALSDAIDEFARKMLMNEDPQIQELARERIQRAR